MKRIDKIIEFLEQRYGRYVKEHSVHKSNPFQVLIGCLLSQRTRDENTEVAINNLFSVAKTPSEILKIPTKKLEKLIKPAGFYRQKAKRIKQICKIVLEKYNGKVPKTREELMELPGVGYKTADVTLCYGFKKPTIPVDVHVFVTSKRLGIAPKDGDVEEVRLALEKLVQENKRYIVNIGFVQFGREICRTRNPKCKICPIERLCSYENKNI